MIYGHRMCRWNPDLLFYGKGGKIVWVMEPEYGFEVEGQTDIARQIFLWLETVFLRISKARITEEQCLRMQMILDYKLVKVGRFWDICTFPE